MESLLLKKLEETLNEDHKEFLRRNLYTGIKELGYNTIAQHILFDDRVPQHLDFLCTLLRRTIKRYDPDTGKELINEDTERHKKLILRLIAIFQELKEKYQEF